MCKVKDKLMELLEYDLTVFGDVHNGNCLYGYHLWTDADNLEEGAEVTIVNCNCEFEFDGVTGTFEPNLYHCFVVDLEIIDVDLEDYIPAKSNNGGCYGFADCIVLKVHERGYSYDDELLKLKAYVEISSYRLKTVAAIGDSVKTPTNIAKESGIRTNHISKVLTELKSKNIVECINEDARKGRLYRLTDYGLIILREL